MSTEELALDLLADNAFPNLAEALRSRVDSIMREWERAVQRTLPGADELTLQQLRNSLPAILQEMITALASDKPREVQELIQGSKSHGSTRFHENYSILEFVVEYRLLRRIIMTQVFAALKGKYDPSGMIALNMAIDTALQSGIVTFTDHLQAQIKASSETQAIYLSFLSHDFRNHLNHATLNLQLLAAKLASAPEHADSVKTIESITRAILNTTTGMDQLLRAEQLRHVPEELDLAAVDLGLMLDDLAREWTREAQAKGIMLCVEVPKNARTISDKGLLTLILQNLLGNAIKYSSQGTVKISAERLASDEAHEWILAISDEGPGIQAQNLENLFHAFKRGDTYGNPGVGLGLTIVSRATRLLDARLEVDSKVNVGTTFRLLLPRLDRKPDHGTFGS